QRNRACQAGIAPAVAFREMQGCVVSPSARGCELGALVRVDSEIVEALLRGEPCVARQDLRWIEINRAMEDGVGKARRRLDGDAAQTGLVDRIPVFQRGFQVAL